MKVIVFGGDARQIYCAGRLSLEPSMDVRRIALGEDSCPMGGVGTADILVLPYVSVKDGYLNAPYSSEKIEFDQAYEYVGQGTLVFCGGITEDIRLELDKRGAKIYDWLADEELTLKNAALTAEGAAQIIVSMSRSAVSGSKILILGCGRVAKACARLFRSMGARVCVSARKESDRELCRRSGVTAAEFIDPGALKEADVIVNTVPERVLDENRLQLIKPGGWILELASKPYGFDFELAKALGVRAVLGSGLPGKYTPESAGELMAEAVIKAAESLKETGGVRSYG